jgi:hypothetical protein
MQYNKIHLLSERHSKQVIVNIQVVFHVTDI